MRPLPTLPLRTSRATIHRREPPAVCRAVNHRTADYRPSPTLPDHREPRPSTIPQLSRGCAIATSTATIRGSVDHPTIANVSGTAREKLWPTLFRFCTKKITPLCGKRLNLEFDLIQSLAIEPSVLSASPSGNSRYAYALFAVTSQLRRANRN
jgi:hypothetical protein